MNNLKLFLKNYNYKFRYKLLWMTPILITLVLFDWISKWIVAANMQQGQEIEFIPGLLKFSYTINPGAALGMNAGNPTLAILLATGVTLLLIGAWFFLQDKKWLNAVNVMLAGSLGNLIARAWAPIKIPGGEKGGVVDFLQWDFNLWGSNTYIFNIADLFVNIAVGLLILFLIWFIVVEIYRWIISKEEVFFASYENHLTSLEVLENNYLNDVKKQKINQQWNIYKVYLHDRKQLKQNWKAFKKEYRQNNNIKQEK
ncbi:signal peptidase II [Spiroplasma culicicola]|uniref:Lipoprotein signal peptidase n=1 Tax=Spiroplasma culicicola AES-1 TaxID=1276246 RepID=W6A7Y8_9MOLU|nr:signal peptidase II [Spiroplasma culicicola]AHI53107.1 lipoprotein signal peptidase [Spiroplasma culicicola AES-1]